MKTMMIALAGAATVIAAVPASATVLDDFNRADASSLGSGWTQQVGTSSISGGAATGTDAALATYNGATGNNLSFDIAIGGGVQYIAGVFGWGSASNMFVKVQSNSGGVFDRFGFYTGNNDPTGPFGDLTSFFSAGHVDISIDGSIATLSITPTGGAVQTYTHDYGFTPGSNSLGLGFYGTARADNFGTTAVAAPGVPEPATWAMMLLGMGLVGAAMRRRQQVSLRYA